MVVMITPVAFSSIGYKTYIIFAVMYAFLPAPRAYRLLLTTESSNAFIFPVVYFFYPETAYRSLEEMDTIFHKCKSIFTVVGIANREPRRYGKDGELLISYEETDEFQRKSSVVGGPPNLDKSNVHNIENTEKELRL